MIISASPPIDRLKPAISFGNPPSATLKIEEEDVCANDSRGS